MNSLDPSDRLRLPPVEQDWKQTFWAIAGVVMFGALLIAAAVYTAPTLISDWQIRQSARPADDVEISDGECSSKLVIHICDATLTVRTGSGTVSRHVNYVFTGMHVGDYSVQPMMDPARPELVTTDMGLDKLWNRTITLAVIVALLLTFTILPIIAAFRNRRAARGA